MRLCFLLCLSLFATTVLGAEFWDDEPPSEWTDQEVTALLTDSPWAITKTIAQGAILPPQRIAPRRRPRVGVSPRTITFTVRWISAPPMHEALRRQAEMEGRGRAQLRQVDRLLGQSDAHYMIMVADMPGHIIEQTNTTEPQLQRGAQLKVMDRFETEPSRVEMRRGGGEAQIIFYFPRSDLISMEDRKIEFRMRLGATTIKREFKPSEMLVSGKLAL